MHRLLVIISFLGLIVSGYLVVASVTPTLPICTPGSNCDVVQSSPYASIFGIPTAAHGVVYYLILGTFGAIWNTANKARLLPPLVFLTGVGFAVSLWLSYLEAFVINAWCIWCVASAILATFAFLIVWLKEEKMEKG